MTHVVIAQTDRVSREAGEHLGSQISAGFSGRPDALIVLASPRNDYGELLEALSRTTGTTTIVGCSSAGEFTNAESGTGLTNVTAIQSTSMRFAASVGTDLSADHRAAAKSIAGGFKRGDFPTLPFTSALVLVDALAGYTEELVSALTLETAGAYRFFGGGAGDDDRFASTHVFCGTTAYSNAAVALEIVSQTPVGIGARHGWTPAGSALRVTEADGANVLSFNSSPAVESFEDHAEQTGQTFDPSEPIPFFLHNVVGLSTDSGFKLRVPLGVGNNGDIGFAAGVPTGSTARIMSTGATSAADAAAAAAKDAIDQVTESGGTPKAAFFFDCVATRLRLGQTFENELDSVSKELGGLPFAGFNSYGQIVRSEGQFSGFHNCTAVVCVLPD